MRSPQAFAQVDVKPSGPRVAGCQLTEGERPGEHQDAAPDPQSKGQGR